ncbi:NAD-dependent epimerase/dehydratase family protein [Pseudenhygromyxa sp. WMMC2535]|uniref:NAD-dependent epimerase/dehydratase family protein n=1 Tax=Pseudenhygromyxa sp. WMMC2535 TaxID=2712867 RepID=UPI0015576A2A|nr:NAD-dependent epimerase/dehydratase family protein [Pseudenhygromyxa sp. WMMC2535]
MSRHRALVTGASGFIGSHLCEVLRERGHDVRAMVRRSSRLDKLEDAAKGEPFALAYAGLDDVAALEQAVRGVDVVYHVAGKTAAFDRAGFDAANVDGVGNLFEAIARAKRAGEGPRRVVLVSSLMAAGPSHPKNPRREHHRVEPGFTDYGDSKLDAEKLALAAAREGELELVIVRPPLVYGPRDEDVLQMIKSAAMRVVAQPGLRPTWMSAIHGRDLAAGIALVGERGCCLPADPVVDEDVHVLAGGGVDPATPGAVLDPRGAGIYYVSDGGRTSVAEFGQVSAALLGRRALTIPMPAIAVRSVGWLNQGIGRARGRVPALTLDKARGSLSPGWWCDDARAREELGWEQQFDLERGLEDTIRWLRDRGEL